MHEERKPQAVLVFPVWERYVLLARKNAKIGAGCWNGYGGRIERRETILEACVRECKEESGLLVYPRELEKIALLDLHTQEPDETFSSCRVHVFSAHAWEGSPKETSEMRNPTWFRISRLPIGQMMLADREWLPQALTGIKIQGEVWYGPHHESLVCPSDLRHESYIEE